MFQNMKDTLDSVDRGVAIAAPQIGISKRIFVVAPKVFENEATETVYINPKISKKSKSQEYMDEGCLSCGSWYGQVERKLQVTLEYQDSTGKKKRRGAGGLLAHIFQHEVDHLDGILFVSKAINLEELDKIDPDDKEQI